MAWRITEPRNRCSTCFYWHSVGEEHIGAKHEGVCKRYPPKTAPGSAPHYRRPYTNDFDTCGEHKHVETNANFGDIMAGKVPDARSPEKGGLYGLVSHGRGGDLQ